MKFLYDLIAGNSRITPLGVLAAGLASFGLMRAHLDAYAVAAFVLILLATLAGGVFEKER